MKQGHKPNPEKYMSKKAKEEWAEDQKYNKILKQEDLDAWEEEENDDLDINQDHDKNGEDAWDDDEEEKQEDVYGEAQKAVSQTFKKKKNSLPGLSKSEAQSLGDVSQLGELVEQRIDELVEELGLTHNMAKAVLMKNKWSVDRSVEAFGKDPDYIKNTFKFDMDESEKNMEMDSNGEKTCGVCFCEYGADEWVSIRECGHGLCKYCFTGYLESKIGDGKEAIFTYCPEAGCNNLCPESHFRELLS